MESLTSEAHARDGTAAPRDAAVTMNVTPTRAEKAAIVLKADPDNCARSSWMSFTCLAGMVFQFSDA